MRALRLTRSGDTEVRLGEAAVVTLTVANPAGRPLRAVLRDAWPPSAGANRGSRGRLWRGAAGLADDADSTRRGDAAAGH